MYNTAAARRRRRRPRNDYYNPEGHLNIYTYTIRKYGLTILRLHAVL